MEGGAARGRRDRFLGEGGLANRKILFSRGHATLHLAVSFVCRSVGHIFEFRAVFALLLLPNRPRLDCRVSVLVFSIIIYCFSF